MNRFFEELGQRWVEVARRRGTPIEAPTLDANVALELLELARVTAHRQERRFAPLSCYLAGIAVERLRTAGGPGIDDSAVVEVILELRHQLEMEDPAPRQP
jgi:uncharacterized protein DUF6457